MSNLTKQLASDNQNTSAIRACIMEAEVNSS